MSLLAVAWILGLAQGNILPSYPIIVRDCLPARSAGASIGFIVTATLFGSAFGGRIHGWIFVDRDGSYFVAFRVGIAWNASNLIEIRFKNPVRSRASKPGGRALDG